MFYQAMCVAKTSNGKGWRGIISYKDGETWKYKSHVMRGAKSKREALRMCALWRDEMEAKASIQPTTRNVVEYALDYVAWKASFGAIDPSTVRDYNLSLRSWKPYLEKIALQDLTRKHIEHGLQMMLKKISPNTAIKRYNVLNMVLEHAVKNGELLKNPMDGIPRPKRKKTLPNSIVGADYERLKNRLETLPLKPWVVAVYLCLYAGLRIEEVAGLKWSDYMGSTLWIRRAIAVGEGGCYVADTKTKRVRDVPVCEKLAEILERWKTLQEQFTWEKSLTPDTWILATPETNLVEPRRIGRYWSMLCEIEDYKGQEGRKPTIHDLRHTFATACVRGGMDVKCLQSILGHASAAMTLDIYASADPQAKLAGIAIIDNSL